LEDLTDQLRSVSACMNVYTNNKNENNQVRFELPRFHSYVL